MGILGLPINDQILEIMRGMADKVAEETLEPKNFSGKHSKQPKTLLPPAKVISDCPRCLGLGFRHDSSAKHDKKQKEKCKNCTTCKGTCFS
jgi:hypothetical protein